MFLGNLLKTRAKQAHINFKFYIETVYETEFFTVFGVGITTMK